MPSSLENKKQLRFIITLGDSKFQGDNDRIILQGYRASVSIDLAGGLQMGGLRARIYGMKKQDVDAITSYSWRLGDFKPNTITVYAIDGKQETIVFTGNIVTAWGDYAGAPDVYLDIQAQSAYLATLKSAPPISFNGPIDAASLIQQLCVRMGYSFENNGVSVVINNAYYAGTDMEKVRKIVEDTGIQMWEQNQLIAIAPKGTARGGLIPLISPQTGLVGYPMFDGQTINLRVLFTPAIQWGGIIRVDTDIIKCKGDWQVLSMSHMLDSESPQGSWFTNVRGVPKGIVSPAVQ